MSIGLAFVQGLVGGFQKNIEREQALRTADDQRLAGLQDTLFQATAKAAAEGNPVPSQLGDMLRKAKQDIANTKARMMQIETETLIYKNKTLYSIVSLIFVLLIVIIVLYKTVK